MSMWAWAALVIIVVVGGYILLAYNSLVRRRNHVREAWSDIDVQFKRRHDLIPNLVETVQGYAAHEREAFASVTQARAQALGARRFYNTNVRDYNTAIESVPTNIVAQLFGFKSEEYFELDDEAARSVPKVAFGK